MYVYEVIDLAFPTESSLHATFKLAWEAVLREGHPNCFSAELEVFVDESDENTGYVLCGRKANQANREIMVQKREVETCE